MTQAALRWIPVHPARKVRNVLRGVLQAYGPSVIKRRLWNAEFAGGRWDCLESSPGDCVYGYVEKYARQGRILDLGCGSGNTGNELAREAYREYVGVDISDVAVAKATRRSHENGRAERNQYLTADIFSYAPAGRFDVILFRDSIYYIQRPKIKGMLERYKRYLTPNGVFIVRLWDGGDDRRFASAIEDNFDVLEKHVAEDSKAVVLVFR
jgi:SAM-dependent methyltransferase